MKMCLGGGLLLEGLLCIHFKKDGQFDRRLQDFDHKYE